MKLIGGRLSSKQLSYSGKVGPPFASDGFYPSLWLFIQASSYHITVFPPQLHCYLSSRPERTTRSPPPVSRNSFIHFSVQGFMCSRPPPTRIHQEKKTKQNKKSGKWCLFSLPLTVCWPTWAQDTGHKPVLTTLCSNPERLIINRLKYSHCRLVFWPFAPMSKPLRETCHVVRRYTPFISQDWSVQEDLDGWFAISIHAVAARLRMIRLRGPNPGAFGYQARRISLILPGREGRDVEAVSFVMCGCSLQPLENAIAWEGHAVKKKKTL